ncbi:MAG: protein-L-isoaspartate(D-aspartate) O-methyltransferase [Dehalococcoidaceae bacterium]|nr:protein-L-isoaspartate(D-aspartate) O-methyltransferase [Dehalococcoidaceae bacterium]
MSCYDIERKKMVSQLRNRIFDNRVLDALSKVPRHYFVPPEKLALAYEDTPLPIGSGQTISQPYIVALMSTALELKGEEKVLEIGTGSGYQAAILAELAAKVITVERLPDMAARAKSVLKTLGYHNIDVRIAEEELGWKKNAPYDAILVAAAAPEIPKSLLDQLVTGGRMVIPAGSRHQQELLKVTKTHDDIEVHSLGGCRFVSLIGRQAWEES